MAKKILLGLTTIAEGGEWKNKVKEIDKLDIKEIALFPTCLNLAERKELYQLLAKTKLEKIPHAHLREEDMENWELDYLVKRYKTQVFNVHAPKEIVDFIDRNGKYKDNIYIENLFVMNGSFEEAVKHCGGVCLDLAHWESHGFREKVKGYEKLPDLLKRYRIGVNHLSAVKSEKVNIHNRFTDENAYHYDSHWLDDLSEVDYAKKYKHYLADIISLELENPSKRQLEVKKYLEKILDL